jgi:hypothetical protein
MQVGAAGTPLDPDPADGATSSSASPVLACTVRSLVLWKHRAHPSQRPIGELPASLQHLFHRLPEIRPFLTLANSIERSLTELRRRHAKLFKCLGRERRGLEGILAVALASSAPLGAPLRAQGRRTRIRDVGDRSRAGCT